MPESSGNNHSVAPGFLVASPKLDGGPFERAVILMTHHDEQGSMGFIVNKPVDVDFGTLISSVNEAIEPQISAQRYEERVFFGGPVRMEQLWVIFRGEVAVELDDPIEEGEVVEPANLRFADGWIQSASGQVIEALATGEGEEFVMPVLGYAGWGAGQLESEIEAGSWLAADFDERLITECAPADCWRRALKLIGVEPTAFLMMAKMGSA